MLQVFQQHSPQFTSAGTSWKWGLRMCSRGKERKESTPDLGHTCSHAKSLQLCPALCDPVDWSLPGSLPMGFSSQEYRSGSPCPPPGDLLNTGIEPTRLMSPKLAGGFFNASWIWWGTLNLVRVSPQKKKRIQRNTEEKAVWKGRQRLKRCVYKPRTTKDGRMSQKLGEDRGQFLPKRLQQELVLPNPQFWIFDIQN